MAGGPYAGAGHPRRRQEPRTSPVRRAASWLAWWVLLDALWLLLVASISMPELLAGAASAALAATVVEAVQHQAAMRISARLEWLEHAASLPHDVLRDTLLVLGAVLRRLVTGRPPASSFRVVPVRPGGDDSRGVTRRALLVAGGSMSPNTLVLDVDPVQAVMLVHHLVPPTDPEPGSHPLHDR